MVRDRDRVYGKIFTRRLRVMGIRDRPIAPRSPWQNGHTERLIGSLRRECLDHVVVFGEWHLRHVLLMYMNYYNRRTHLSLIRMRRYYGLFRPLGAFTQAQFSVDYTIGTFGFDLRQGQEDAVNSQTRGNRIGRLGLSYRAMPLTLLQPHQKFDEARIL
jgi:hypothetical protein